MSEIRSYRDEIVEAIEEFRAEGREPRLVKINSNLIPFVFDKTLAMENKDHTDAFMGVPVEVVENSVNPYFEWSVG